MAIPGILTGAAGRALRTLEPLRANTKPLDALVAIGRATPDMTTALGDDVAKRLGKQLMDASRRGGTASSAASREQVRLALDELSAAASSTARTRVAIGAIGLGGLAAAGYAVSRALGDEDHEPIIMAPGPIGGVPGFDPAVDPTGVVL